MGVAERRTRASSGWLGGVCAMCGLQSKIISVQVCGSLWAPGIRRSNATGWERKRVVATSRMRVRGTRTADHRRRRATLYLGDHGMAAGAGS